MYACINICIINKTQFTLHIHILCKHKFWMRLIVWQHIYTHTHTHKMNVIVISCESYGVIHLTLVAPWVGIHQFKGRLVSQCLVQWASRLISFTHTTKSSHTYLTAHSPGQWQIPLDSHIHTDRDQTQTYQRTHLTQKTRLPAMNPINNSQPQEHYSSREQQVTHKHTVLI